MTRFEILDVIQELRATGAPFCVATVVRTADLTSAKAGAKAVVTTDGEVIGHLGGACVLRAVRLAAAGVLDSGAATMISVRPSRQDAAAEPDIEVHMSGCPSGGTVDVFIEPYLLALRLAVVGDTPIARAVAAHGALMGYAVTQPPAGSDTAMDMDADAVVVASQGTGDLDALRAALQSSARYIAMVASHRKAAALKARLAEDGIAPERLADLVSPAGLDLGAIDPHEIAVSIVAQLISWRRQAERRGTGTGPR